MKDYLKRSRGNSFLLQQSKCDFAFLLQEQQHTDYRRPQPGLVRSHIPLSSGYKHLVIKIQQRKDGTTPSTHATPILGAIEVVGNKYHGIKF